MDFKLKDKKLVMFLKILMAKEEIVYYEDCIKFLVKKAGYTY